MTRDATTVDGREGGRLGERLRRADAPRFVDEPFALATLGGDPAAARAAIDALVAAGDLAPAGEGLFANRQARPAVHPNEMVPHLCPDAVVGLRTVLGEHGVTNNPSRVIYAVRRAAPDRAPDVTLRFPFAQCRLLAMDPAVLAAGDEADRREAGGRYPRATPERALCDWLHLSSPAGGRLMAPPGTDLDLSALDGERMVRLAAAMGIADLLAVFLARQAEAEADPAHDEQVSPILGY